MTPRLNVDLAELHDEPETLYSYAQLVNVSCGAHAGDEALARSACTLATRHGAQPGAHPSYPDREHFGRKRLSLSDAALRETLRAQLRWLDLIARASGVALMHVKPHGALYHAARDLPEVAAAVIEVTHEVLGDVAMVGPPEGRLRELCSDRGLPYLREGFADRGYLPDGSLVPRGEPGALLDDLDAVRAQVRRLVRDGSYDTLCVHGDGPHAVAIARAVREVLG